MKKKIEDMTIKELLDLCVSCAPDCHNCPFSNPNMGKIELKYVSSNRDCADWFELIQKYGKTEVEVK